MGTVVMCMSRHTVWKLYPNICIELTNILSHKAGYNCLKCRGTDNFIGIFCQWYYQIRKSSDNCCIQNRILMCMDLRMFPDCINSRIVGWLKFRLHRYPFHSDIY